MTLFQNSHGLHPPTEYERNLAPYRKVYLNNQGFTLIEALMAMFVLAIGILAVNTMQISSMRGNATANKLTATSTLAGNIYERLLSVSYDDSTMNTNSNANPHDDTEINGLQLPSHVSSVEWNVREWTTTDGIDNDGDGTIDESDEMSIKTVTLNIHYNDIRAKTLTVIFYKSGML